MVARYDFVVTSGGIGPTHDGSPPSSHATPLASHSTDITYASLAKAFHQPLSYHPETLARMEEHIRLRSASTPQNEDQHTALRRMALFPHAAEVLFVAPDLWVVRTLLVSRSRAHAPAARCPSRGQALRLPRHSCPLPTDARQPRAPATPPAPARPSLSRTGVHKVRHHLISQSGVTYGVSLPESSIAPYLATLQKRVNADGIRIGSYPLLQRGVYVSLIGDRDRVRQLAQEVEKEIEGRIVSEAEAEAKRQSSST